MNGKYKSIDEKILAYTAGLFDGEGCVSIAKWKIGTSKRYHSPRHVLRVLVSNTNKEVLTWIKEKFGGYISNHSSNKSLSSGHSPSYSWNLERKRAMHFLESISPLLIIKRRTTELAIEFQKWINEEKRTHPVSKEVIAKRDWYKKEISRLCHYKSSSQKKYD